MDLGRPTDIMTTAEVAALLRRPVATLRYWRHRGEGPASFRLGGLVVYSRKDVDAWIDAQKAASVSGAVAS